MQILYIYTIRFSVLTKSLDLLLFYHYAKKNYGEKIPL